MNKNVITPPENPLLVEARKLEEQKKAKEISDRLKKAQESKQEEIKSKLEKLEILPLKDKVILLPYPSNPYNEFITEGGLYIKSSGDFFNTDSGEQDRMTEMVQCAKVIEIGPECKYVQVGDDVYFDSRTAYPFPFMMNGYKLTSESGLLAILNENLKERLNNGK